MKLLRLTETGLGHATAEIETMSAIHNYPCSVYEFVMMQKIIGLEESIAKLQAKLEVTEDEG